MIENYIKTESNKKNSNVLSDNLILNNGGHLAVEMNNTIDTNVVGDIDPGYGISFKQGAGSVPAQYKILQKDFSITGYGVLSLPIFKNLNLLNSYVQMSFIGSILQSNQKVVFGCYAYDSDPINLTFARTSSNITSMIISTPTAGKFYIHTSKTDIDNLQYHLHTATNNSGYQVSLPFLIAVSDDFPDFSNYEITLFELMEYGINPFKLNVPNFLNQCIYTYYANFSLISGGNEYLSIRIPINSSVNINKALLDFNLTEVTNINITTSAYTIDTSNWSIDQMDISYYNNCPCLRIRLIRSSNSSFSYKTFKVMFSLRIEN